MTPLTEKQRLLLTAIWNGWTPKEIAADLGVTDKAIDTQLVTLGRQLGARTVPHMMRKGCELGVLLP